MAVDQLDDDPHALAVLPDAALQHIADPKLAADLLDLHRPAAISERRIVRDHQKAGHLREIGGDIVGDAVAEIPLLRVAAQIVEWQDHDGWLVPRSPAGFRFVLRRKADETIAAAGNGDDVA